LLKNKIFAKRYRSARSPFHDLQQRANGRTLDQATPPVLSTIPTFGGIAGYLQVTRLTGHGPALVVVPDARLRLGLQPNPGQANSFGAHHIHRPDSAQRNVEGFYEWMVHSQAYAENEWKGVQQWNPPPC